MHTRIVIALAGAVVACGAASGVASAQDAPVPGTTPVDSAETLYWEAYEAYQRGIQGQTPSEIRRATSLWAEAARIFRRLGESRYLETVYRQMAAAFDELGEPDSSRVYLERVSDALAIAERARLREPFRGFTLGGAFVSSRLSGSVNEPLGAGFGADLQLRYALPAGFSALVGGAVGLHGVTVVDYSFGARRSLGAPYNLRSLFAGARWAWHLDGRAEPFLEVRGGRVWEGVNASGARFAASGSVWGGSVGVQLRVHRQLALEGGMRVQRAAFGDFTFSGEAAIDGCLTPLRESGAVLPVALDQCAGAGGPAQLTPCGDELLPTGTGCRPSILHPGSRRHSTFAALWMGVTLVLGGR